MKELTRKHWLVIFLILCHANSFSQKKTATMVLKPLTADDTTIIAKECSERRQLLADKLKNGIIVINNNENTEDNFFYLTGWRGKPAACFIDLENSSPYTLFITDASSKTIIWNGKQAGKEEAYKLRANTLNYPDFGKQLKKWLRSYEKIYLLNQDKETDDCLKSLIITHADSNKIVYIDTLVNEMRVVKSYYEIENIKNAIGVTANAFNNAFRTVKPNIYEYEVAALFNYEYIRNGLKEAFPCIVGSGKNSTTLHYETNNKLTAPDEVLLMDVGAEYNGYAADITRTIPVNGKFTQSQLDLYNLVLKAQEEGIKVMKPGFKIFDFHNKCVDVLTKGLYQLGFITDSTKTWQKEIFILYQAGHYLGLDVHDVGRYSCLSSCYTNSRQVLQGRDLIPGMVITVEPGIYINPDMLRYIYRIYGNSVPKSELDMYVKKTSPLFQKYADIGIRIEDDVLITATGNDVLSEAIAKQPEEIERLMHKK